VDTYEQVALSGQALGRAAAGGARLPLATPWLCDLALRVTVVLLFANFARPALSFVMAPALEMVAGEHALHYPQALLALPGVVLQVGAAIELVWLPLVTAWSVMLFAAAYRGEDPHLLGRAPATLARAPRILLVGAPLVALRTFAATLTKAGIAEIAHRPMHGVAQGASASSSRSSRSAPRRSRSAPSRSTTRGCGSWAGGSITASATRAARRC
jgi:hypothetical protein